MINSSPDNLNDIGIVFVGPIIGITPSLINTFKPIIDKGASLIGVDIFDDSYEKKTFWKIIKLTMHPRAHANRIRFANAFPEHKVFDKIRDAINQLIQQGKNKIVLGGMSGGFVFVGRVLQSPPDQEILEHDVYDLRHHVIGLFGISPIIFYPPGVHRPDVSLDLIPFNIRTLLFFSDGDDIIPPGTMEYVESVAKAYPHIKSRYLKCEEFSNKSKSIKHQYFGGHDFVRPLKNVFWHPEAEACTINMTHALLKELATLN